MKAYIRLGLNTEYHGYDLYTGIFKSIEEAIANTAKWYSHVKNLGYITYTHKDEEYYPAAYPHTHVVFFNKDFGTPSETELIKALEKYDEIEFYGSGYAILNGIVLQEERL